MPLPIKQRMLEVVSKSCLHKVSNSSLSILSWTHFDQAFDPTVLSQLLLWRPGNISALINPVFNSPSSTYLFFSSIWNSWWFFLETLHLFSCWHHTPNFPTDPLASTSQCSLLVHPHLPKLFMMQCHRVHSIFEPFLCLHSLQLGDLVQPQAFTQHL